jgi:hypothetical protein
MLSPPPLRIFPFSDSCILLWKSNVPIFSFGASHFCLRDVRWIGAVNLSSLWCGGLRHAAW